MVCLFICQIPVCLSISVICLTSAYIYLSMSLIIHLFQLSIICYLCLSICKYPLIISLSSQLCVIYLSVTLSIHPSVCLNTSIHPSFFQFLSIMSFYSSILVCFSFLLPVSNPFFIHLSINLCLSSVNLSIHPSMYASIFSATCLIFIHHPSIICQSFYLPINTCQSFYYSINTCQSSVNQSI